MLYYGVAFILLVLLCTYLTYLVIIFAGVQQCVEGQEGEFTLVCRDSAGELTGKGGDSVLVSIIHTEKKEWCVSSLSYYIQTCTSTCS